MTNKFKYISSGVVLCLLVGALFLYPHDQVAVLTAEAAKRSFALDGELYIADSKGISTKVGTGREVRAVYGETENDVLIGKDLKINNSHSSDVGLFFVDKTTSEAKKVTEDRIEFALLDNAKKNVLFLTPEGKIKRKNLATNYEEEIADLASIPSISPDDKYLAFKKMPEGWTAGDYSEGSPGVVVREIASGKERVMADQEADHAAFWTPDGSYMYFFGDNGYGLDSLFMIDSSGENRTLLTNIDLKEYDPKTIIPSISEPPIISQDGRYFIYESDREIWLVDIDTEQRKMRDARRIGYGISPAWEKDSESVSIVFSGNGQKSKPSIILVDLEGNLLNQN